MEGWNRGGGGLLFLRLKTTKKTPLRKTIRGNSCEEKGGEESGEKEKDN